MLHRTTSTSTWRLDPADAWQIGERVGLNTIVARYLLVLAVICALGCIYLWQASDLSKLHTDIADLEWQMAGLEKENIRLAQQSALWNAPGYIEKRMQEEGFVDAQSVIYTQVPATLVQPESDRPTQHVALSPGSQ